MGMRVIVAVDDNSDVIKERHLSHIAEISKNLKPIDPRKLEKLSPDQEDFLNRRGRYARYFPESKQKQDTVEDEEQW